MDKSTLAGAVPLSSLNATLPDAPWSVSHRSRWADGCDPLAGVGGWAEVDDPSDPAAVGAALYAFGGAVLVRAAETSVAVGYGDEGLLLLDGPCVPWAEVAGGGVYVPLDAAWMASDAAPAGFEAGDAPAACRTIEPGEDGDEPFSMDSGPGFAAPAVFAPAALWRPFRDDIDLRHIRVHSLLMAEAARSGLDVRATADRIADAVDADGDPFAVLDAVSELRGEAETVGGTAFGPADVLIWLQILSQLVELLRLVRRRKAGAGADQPTD